MQTMVHEAKGRITMKITEKNYIQQLQLHNEEALIYVIDMYGGLLKAVIRKHLFTMPQKQEECMNDVLLSIWEHAASLMIRRTASRTGRQPLPGTKPSTILENISGTWNSFVWMM